MMNMILNFKFYYQNSLKVNTLQYQYRVYFFLKISLLFFLFVKWICIYSTTSTYSTFLCDYLEANITEIKSLIYSTEMQVQEFISINTANSSYVKIFYVYYTNPLNISIISVLIYFMNFCAIFELSFSIPE